jgi:K+-sensing histidine kinase KdpD
MTERSVFLDYRVRVVRIGLLVSWVAFAAMTLWTIAFATDQEAPEPLVLVLAGVALILLTITPWRRALAGRAGEWLISVWAGIAVGGLFAAESVRDGQPSAIGFLLVVVVCGTLLLPEGLLLIVTGASFAGYALSILQWEPPNTTTTAILLGAFGVASVLIETLFFVLNAELRTVARRLAHVEERERQQRETERELAQLYEVSRTIGSGSNLAEVLPELVGRLARAIDAKVGLVLLYRPATETLEVMSPIWVAGHTVKVHGYSLALIEAGLPQKVFTSGDPAMNNTVQAGEYEDALLSDLQPSSIAVVPLRIEARPIGLLLTADKASGPFTEDDLETLEALAGPAALVLNQMARYEEARATGEKMAELARLKTDFVSVVSHELRSPLTSIIGSLTTLQRPELAPENNNARELIAMAAKQANRLRTLIEDLLVVSRLEVSAMPTRPESLAAHTFVDEIVEGIPGTERRVRVAVADDLIRIEADPDHLSRILTNLVDNALKHAGDAPIEVTARSVEDETWLAVVDHGPGIPYELREHVFDRFTQVQHHETRSRGGSGLGLSIVRGLAEAMRGRVWYEPTVGGGATFTVAIPAGGSRATSAVSAGASPTPHED